MCRFTALTALWASVDHLAFSRVAFKDRIAALKPRETSGPRTSNRFEFQRSWALCHLLERHSSNKDYYLVFDYFDDVVCFDSEANPQSAEAYQVKTKTSGVWTLAKLTKQEKGADSTKLPSIVGKMFTLRQQLPHDQVSLHLVSNVPFDFDLADESSCDALDRVEIDLLDAAEEQRLSKHLTAELGLTTPPTLRGVLSFLTTDLSIKGHADLALGRLSKFLDQLSATKKYPIGAIYKSVSDEIRRRNDREIVCATYEDLRHKGISRSEFDDMIQSFGLQRDWEQEWSNAANRLNSENMPFARVQDLRRDWALYEVERMDASNAVLRDVSVRVLSVLRGGARSTLTETLQAVSDVVVDNTGSYNQTYVQAIALMELHNVQPKLSTAGPQPQKAIP